MSSVQLSKFTDKNNGIFKRFDKDNNGLDKKEMASATQDAINNKDYATASLLGTMSVGGKDNKGLMHDPNGDGRVSQDELKQFAGLADKKDAIDTADFTAGFGDAAKENNFFGMLDASNNESGAGKAEESSEGQDCSGGGCEESGGGGEAGGAESAKPSSAAGQAGGGSPAGGGGESGGGGAPAQGANQQQQPQGVEQIMQMILQLLQALMQQMGGQNGQQPGQQPGAAGGVAGATTPGAAGALGATPQAGAANASAFGAVRFPTAA